MNYQEQIKNAVRVLYELTKEKATSRHYTFGYGWVCTHLGINLNNKPTQDDFHEMSYSNEFNDLIQTLDFDDIKKEVTIMIWEKGKGGHKMRKYTLKDWEAFCKNALICPPFEDEKSWHKWNSENKIHIVANGCDMELDYDADTNNELEFALREIHEAILGDGTATTGNTIGSEYRDATWKDILRFVVWDGFYEDSHSIEVEIQKCIERFSKDKFAEVMQKIENQTSANDELEVNFFKLNTSDLWKLFDKEERRQAFTEIICSKLEIFELVDEKGNSTNNVVILDCSFRPQGDVVGHHFGIDFDEKSEDNQYYIQTYIERMTR